MAVTGVGPPCPWLFTHLPRAQLAGEAGLSGSSRKRVGARGTLRPLPQTGAAPASSHQGNSWQMGSVTRTVFPAGRALTPLQGGEPAMCFIKEREAASLRQEVGKLRRHS